MGQNTRVSRTSTFAPCRPIQRRQIIIRMLFNEQEIGAGGLFYETMFKWHHSNGSLPCPSTHPGFTKHNNERSILLGSVSGETADVHLPNFLLCPHSDSDKLS